MLSGKSASPVSNKARDSLKELRVNTRKKRDLPNQLATFTPQSPPPLPSQKQTAPSPASAVTATGPDGHMVNTGVTVSAKEGAE